MVTAVPGGVPNVVVSACRFCTAIIRHSLPLSCAKLMDIHSPMAIKHSVLCADLFL